MGADGTVVYGNAVKKSGPYGIYVDTTDNMVTGNTVKKSGTTDLCEDSNGSGNICSNNNYSTTSL